VPAAGASADSPGQALPAAESPREFDGDWPALAAVLPVAGLSRQFMQQSELIGHDGLSFSVRVPIKPLAEAGTVAKVRQALSTHFGAPVRLGVEVGEVSGPTAAAAQNELRAQRLDEARAAIESDPFVQTLLTDFDGRIVPDSVKPIDP
jgi:DNA polymerase-3 subunit gamma/tau